MIPCCALSSLFSLLLTHNLLTSQSSPIVTVFERTYTGLELEYIPAELSKFYAEELFQKKTASTADPNQCDQINIRIHHIR